VKRSLSAPEIILRFICLAIIFYALFFWLWSYVHPPYTAIITSFANEELHVLDIDAITRTGPSLDPKYDIAVYHRDAADMQDSLFDFRLESIRSTIPILLALIIAMPVPWKRKIKPLIAGSIAVIIMESMACVMIMIWSYTFLPDQNKFSPFHASPIRNSIIGYFYDFYNSMGVGFFPVIIWIIVCVRKDLIRRLFGPGMRH
jgi:hypothetical protein